MDKKLILLVDDEPFIIEVMKFYLESENFQVIYQDDGQNVYDIALNKKPDLILLDLMLPSISGYEICKIIKDDPKTSNIPVFIMSAKTQKADIEKALESGADKFVKKPCDMPALIKDMNEFLLKKQ